MNRFVVYRLFIVVLFVAMSTRLYTLQIRRGASLSEAAEGHTVQRIWDRPLRGEIFAADAKTRLAESLPAFTIAIRPSQLPPATVQRRGERQLVFARLDDMLHLQSNIALSPTQELRYVDGLRAGLETLTGQVPASVFASPIYTATVPVQHAVNALHFTEQFQRVLTFSSSVEQLLRRKAGPPYETVPVTTTRSLDLALMIKENSAYLPGVVVERDYQRSYPHSGEVPSLSHLLGYIGDVDMCDILHNNPPSAYNGSYGSEAEALCNIEPGQLLAESAPLRYLFNDRIGRDGLERTFETILRGSLGQEQVEVDVHSRLVAEPQVLRPPQNGDNVVLTIDLELQKKTEAIVRKWIAEAEHRRQNPAATLGFQRDYSPIEAGVAIAVEVDTGRVLSMVSWPAFDNNIFNHNRTQQDVDRIFNPKWPHPAPAINQAIVGLFPPGSTWKQVSASMALESGKLDAETMVHDPGVLFVKNQYYDTNPKYDERFPNSFGGDRGQTNIKQALQFSSNVFFQSVVGGTKFVRNVPDSEKRAGIDPEGEALANMARAFGFDARTGINLPGEAKGQMPSKTWKANLPEWSPLRKEPWNVADIYNTVIGQGNVLVTPLQLTMASAALANGGTLYKPQLVSKIIGGDGHTVRNFEPEVNRHVPISRSTVRTIHEGMRLAITSGFDTCARDDIAGLSIAGKTGTAEYTELIDPKKPYSEENLRKRSHAWFAGFAPYDHPKIEVLVLVEGAGDMTDGSATITVPAVTEIMQSYFNVQPPPPSFKPVLPYNLPCH
ncbi:MAG: penicillin-binding transpeptidase domain-containing protein [Herpetosiphon sp.]